MAYALCNSISHNLLLAHEALPTAAATPACVTRACTLPRPPLVRPGCMSSHNPQLMSRSAAVGGFVVLSTCGACLCGAGLVLPCLAAGRGFLAWLRASFVFFAWAFSRAFSLSQCRLAYFSSLSVTPTIRLASPSDKACAERASPRGPSPLILNTAHPVTHLFAFTPNSICFATKLSNKGLYHPQRHKRSAASKALHCHGSPGHH
jgi:hypothetical protein